MNWNKRESLQDFRRRQRTARDKGRMDAAEAAYKANPSKVWAEHNVNHGNGVNRDTCVPCKMRAKQATRARAPRKGE